MGNLYLTAAMMCKMRLWIKSLCQNEKSQNKQQQSEAYNGSLLGKLFFRVRFCIEDIVLGLGQG